MAKRIIENEVAAFLLSDGWHEVVSGSFELDHRDFLLEGDEGWIAVWREEKHSDQYFTCLASLIQAFRMKVMVELPE